MTKQASTENLKNKLAEKETTAPPQEGQNNGISPYRKVEAYLKKMAPQIEASLPQTGVTAERLSRIALTTIKTNPTLLTAEIDSLLGAVMQSAQLGLEPNLLGSCYFIPYKDNNTGKTTVSFQIGYKGYIDLVTRSGEVLFLEAMPVYKGDIFRASKGTINELYHEQTWTSEEEIENITHFYAYAKLRNGETVFRVMSVKAINKIRDEHSKSHQYKKGNSIWSKHYEAMAMKTVIKQLVKYLPISVELQNKVAHDETVRNGLEAEPQKVDIIDVESTDSEEN